VNSNLESTDSGSISHLDCAVDAKANWNLDCAEEAYKTVEEIQTHDLFRSGRVSLRVACGDSTEYL